MASITTPCVVDAMRQYQQHDAVGSCSRTVDTASTAIGGLPGSTLSVIGVGSPDTFVYPRINRLEMPGTEPELLRSGETTPITLSVYKACLILQHILVPCCLSIPDMNTQCCESNTLISNALLGHRFSYSNTCAEYFLLLWCFSTMPRDWLGKMSPK